MEGSEVTHNGCKLDIPNLAARTPVMSGSTALPAMPMPAIQPIAPVSSQRGRTFFAWLTTIGYIGPMRTPITDTATAFSMREGTAQMVASRLMTVYTSTLVRKGGEKL